MPALAQVALALVLVTARAMTQREALLDIYVRNDGVNWLRKGEWGGPNECLFQGVSCQNGDVVSLVLFGFGLRGPLLANLSALPALTLLNCAHNALTALPDLPLPNLLELH
eukprot:gene8224-7563_t